MSPLKFEQQAGAIKAALGLYRFRFGTEAELQEQIQTVLDSQFPGLFFREYKLSEKERPDFFQPSSGIVLEVKVRGSFAQVFRQLMRYALHPKVKGIALISGKPYDGVPQTLNTKPITNINLISHTL